MSEIRVVMDSSLEEKVSFLMKKHKISSKRDLIFYLVTRDYEEEKEGKEKNV
jgi:hypothetical protein